jgi:hypothetical protein
MLAKSLAGGLETLVLSTMAQGRRIGQMIDADPARYGAMTDYPLSAALNTLGCPSWTKPVPFTLPDGRSLPELSVVQRCVLYEALSCLQHRVRPCRPSS